MAIVGMAGAVTVKEHYGADNSVIFTEVTGITNPNEVSIVCDESGLIESIYFGQAVEDAGHILISSHIETYRLVCDNGKWLTVEDNDRNIYSTPDSGYLNHFKGDTLYLIPQ